MQKILTAKKNLQFENLSMKALENIVFHVSTV